MIDQDDNKKPAVILPRWWGAICVVCGAPAFLIYARLGHLDKALIAMYSISMMILVGRIFWNFRGRLWFWFIMVGVSVLHGILVAYIHFARSNYPVVLILGPLATLDFIFVFLVFRFAEVRFR